MNQQLRALASDLRKMSSRDAADWLMDRYPAGSNDWGKAISLLRRRSWERADQVRLAHHYLSRLPFASPKPYEAFASFMQVSWLIDIVSEHIPSNEQDRSLLEYHLGPVLAHAAKTAEDHEKLQHLMLVLNARPHDGV
jgi:hypothetical protein